MAAATHPRTPPPRRRSAPDLRVGITARDDAEPLRLCLESLRRTLEGVSHEVVVLDYGSHDGTAEVAREAGATVAVRPLHQGDALNWLLATSRSPHTLLLHSDVVLLSEEWYQLVSSALTGNVVLVSPDDSGVGPHLRAAYGTGKPESSFLLWRTEAALRLRRLRLRRAVRSVLTRERMPSLRGVNLYHQHVTHYLPAILARHGLAWRAMDVLPSPRVEPWYVYRGGDPAANWDPAWACYAYGFGNFYALEGTITHYHQWYARHSGLGPDELNDDRVPAGFLREAAGRFRRDYEAGALRLPDA